MFSILDKAYKEKMGRSILFSELGQSTKHFNFFLTQSISQTLTLTSQKGASSSGKTEQSLVNRLLQLSSEGKFSKIDTFVEKLSQHQSAPTSVLRHQTDTNKLDSIAEEEEDEEQKFFEKEAEQVFLEEDAEGGNGPAQDEEEKDIKTVEFEVLDMEKKLNDESSKNYEAVCHSFFIAKDNTEINWRTPYVQQSSVSCKIRIADKAFAEGAMRYAFQCFDKTYNTKYIAKLPKKISPSSYKLEVMKQDLESIFICKLIVDDLNERLIS
jgi:hypothetical protein